MKSRHFANVRLAIHFWCSSVGIDGDRRRRRWRRRRRKIPIPNSRHGKDLCKWISHKMCATVFGARQFKSRMFYNLLQRVFNCRCRPLNNDTRLNLQKKTHSIDLFFVVVVVVRSYFRLPYNNDQAI